MDDLLNVVNPIISQKKKKSRVIWREKKSKIPGLE
jgi:hypothetical protein